MDAVRVDEAAAIIIISRHRWAALCLRLCVALGVLLFHASLLLHVSALALILTNAMAASRYGNGAGGGFDDGTSYDSYYSYYHRHRHRGYAGAPLAHHVRDIDRQGAFEP
jgi:hypothetical protein